MSQKLLRIRQTLFLVQFNTKFHSYCVMPEDMIRAGDFNFHFDNSDDVHGTKLLDLLECHNM